MIDCKIISPQKTIFSGKVKSITLPSAKGECQVLPGHAESFFLLNKGEIILRGEIGEKRISISEGIFHIKEDQSIILINPERKHLGSSL